MSTHHPLDLDEEPDRDKERRVSAQLATENEAADFVWLMGGPRGRRFMRRLLEKTDVTKSSFRLNAMQMAHAEGEKHLGYWIRDLLEEHCLEDYRTMIEERKK